MFAWAGCGGGNGGTGTGGAGSGQTGVGGAAGAGGGGVAGAGGSGNTAGPISAADYPARLVAATCEILVSCGAAPDQATCVAATSSSDPWIFPTIEQDITSGKVSYDGNQAAACVAAFGTPSCTETWNAAFQAASAQPCNAIFVGTVPAGGTCFLDSECAPGTTCVVNGTTCDPTTQCCSGSCVSGGATVPLNGDCSDSTSTCVFGTYCDYSGATPTCLAQLTTPGASCATAQCALPLFCDPGTTTCMKPAAAGTPCVYNAQTVGASCEDARDVCDATTGTCVGPVSVGATCTGTTLCPRSTYCDTTGTAACVPFRKAGAACTATAQCLLDLVCDPITNTCTLPMAAACQ
jgi:hypothetical protein